MYEYMKLNCFFLSIQRMVNTFCRSVLVLLPVKLTSQSPSALFRVPVNIIFLFLLKILHSDLENRARQSLSHICPIKIKDALHKSLNICFL